MTRFNRYFNGWKLALTLVVVLVSLFGVYNVIWYPEYAMYMAIGVFGGAAYMVLCGMDNESDNDPHDPLTVRN